MTRVEVTKAPSPAGEVTLYKLTNASGAQVVVSSLGAGIVAVRVPDRDGRLDDVCLGYADPADYLADGPCCGKTPGRYANRIAGGRLIVDGRLHKLAVNNGPNALHGGPTGFQNRIWDSHADADGKVVFSRVSPDGEEHYPGTLTAGVTYEWTDDNTLNILYHASTDDPTVVNLTNHAYWNLDGHASGCVLDHELQLNARKWLPTDSTLIPTGELADVEGTPMDFTAAKPLGRDIKADFPALRYGKGYDNCWVLDRRRAGEPVVAAVLTAPRSGRRLEVATTQPGVQVYTGNWLDGSPVSKAGRPYCDYDGVAIECQGLPDAPNQPGFPSQRLDSVCDYRQAISFRFTTAE